MAILNIISIISIITIPIFAVWLGQFLQNRSAVRNEKVEIFKMLMFYRNIGYVDMEAVKHLNLVPILFIKNKKIMENYNIYVDIKNKRTLSDDDKHKLEQSKKAFLEEMAKELGYKEINWKIIENPYLPKETLDQKEMANQLISGMSNFFGNESVNNLFSIMEKEFDKINDRIDKIENKKK